MRVRVHRVDVDVVAHFGRDGSIVPACVQWLDGRSFPVDEVLEVTPFSGPRAAGGRPGTASGSGGTRPSCTSSSGPRDRRRRRPRSSCGGSWRGIPSSRAERHRHHPLRPRVLASKRGTHRVLARVLARLHGAGGLVHGGRRARASTRGPSPARCDRSALCVTGECPRGKTSAIEPTMPDALSL